MSLSVDLWKLRQDLEDCQARLECLKECHLQERPQGYLPDFVFPLQKALAQALEEIPILQQEFREEVRPEVRKAIQFLMEDPEAQVLMEKLAQAEAQELDWLAQGRLTDL
jgi:hypothetical protein